MPLKQMPATPLGRRSGLKCHPVSIGAMRLPQDTEEAVALIRQAIDAGMTYIDTSRGYGDSEIKLGKALKDGYREKVILSTKWAPWITKIEETDDTTADCTYKRISESMERLDVSYLDFYQVWNIQEPQQYEAAIAKGGMLDGILRAIKEGIVGHTGFTTHDKPENVSRYLAEADWCEAVLCTHNIMNQTYQLNLAEARRRGIATIVMNPAGGGLLAEESPVMKKALKEDSVVETAHRYLASDTNIDTVLCGISKPTDITTTIANFLKPKFTPQRCREIEGALKSLAKDSIGFCTDCRYCLPCPQGINIPGVMHANYLARILQCPEAAQRHYRSAVGDKPASLCVACHQCEKKCTQSLPIVDEMAYAVEKFAPAESS